MGDAPALAALMLTHVALAAAAAALAWVALRNVATGSARERLRLACVAFYGAALLPLTALLPQRVSVSIGQGAAVELWAAPVISDAPHWFVLAAAVIIALIAAGIGWRLGLTLFAVLHGERLAARATPLAPEQFGLPDGVRIGRSDDAPGPAVAGLLRPVILLPARLEHAPRETLLPLLHHEFAHVLRRDVRNALLQRLVEDAFWWNPVMRLMASWLSEARELVCDEIACATAERRAYAEALISEAHVRAQSEVLVAPAGGGSVERRLERLIEPRRTRAMLSAAALGMVILIAGMAFTPRSSTENTTHIGIASS